MVPSEARLLLCPTPAGFPSPAQDDMEEPIDLAAWLVDHPAASYLMRVSGHSMTDAEIVDGDIVVVSRAVEARRCDTDHPLAAMVVSGIGNAKPLLSRTPSPAITSTRVERSRTPLPALMALSKSSEKIGPGGRAAPAISAMIKARHKALLRPSIEPPLGESDIMTLVEPDASEERAILHLANMMSSDPPMSC